MTPSKVVIVIVAIIVLIVTLFFVGKKDIDPSIPPLKIRVEECPGGVIVDTQSGEQCLLSETVSTSEWKTYTNAKYAYEVKYPGTFSQIKATDPDILLLRSTSDYQEGTDLTFAGLSVDTNTSVAQCKDDPRQPIEDVVVKELQSKNYTNAVIGNNLCYMIRYNYVYGDIKSFDEAKVLMDLKEIVASFKFINTAVLIVPVSTTTVPK
jgi:hypothetical protein